MSNPLDLKISNRFLKRFIEKLTGLDRLKDLYQKWLDSEKPDDLSGGAGLLDFALNELDTDISLNNEERLSEIPRSGPLIFVSNHPLGALEGMLLTRLLLSIRPDLKVLTNEVLLMIPEFSHLFIGVDVLNPNRQQSNSKGMRTLSRHLVNNGAVLIFPAGTVSGIKLGRLSVQDAEWHELVGRLALKYGASCVPLRVNERNSLYFYLSGLIHKRLRTAMLGRAMLEKKGQAITADVGNVIDMEEIRHLAESKAITLYFRFCCELLASGSGKKKQKVEAQESIREDVEKSNLQNQLNSLKEFIVVEQKSFKVYCAPYDRLGCMMEQIAISREKTFRAVDEGTGKELDSDRFDPCYWHLWIWDDLTEEVVGGYRIAKVDEIVAQHGIENLYSRSLYEFKAEFLDALGKVVEVGRSFITPEYQRHPRALDLLWKGIGAFMVDNPGYHTLFGCVSISQQYSNLARSFLADTFLYHYSAESSIKQSVQPTQPLKSVNRPWSKNLLSSVSDIPIINKLLGRIDSGKSIPILIRHYLALNGRFISFSVNHGFNHSLDGLIMVDLRNVPDKYLNRYLSTDGANEFRKIWGIQSDVA